MLVFYIFHTFYNFLTISISYPVKKIYFDEGGTGGEREAAGGGEEEEVKVKVFLFFVFLLA